MVHREILGKDYLDWKHKLLFLRYDNRCRHLQLIQVQNKLDQGVPHVIRFRLETGVEPFQDMIFGWNHHDVAQVRVEPLSLYTYVMIWV